VARAGQSLVGVLKCAVGAIADGLGPFQDLNTTFFALESVCNSIAPNRRDNGHIKDGNAA
jgi:hypothetical protein